MNIPQTRRSVLVTQGGNANLGVIRHSVRFPDASSSELALSGDDAYLLCSGQLGRCTVRQRVRLIPCA